MCGCVPRPAHPPHLPARRVGAALKGLGVGLRRQGIGAEERGGDGAGVRCAVGSVTCVPLTPRLPQAPGLPGPGGSRNLASPGEGTKVPRQPRLVFPLCYGPWLDGTCRATATLPGVPVACWFFGESERPERPPGRSVSPTVGHYAPLHPIILHPGASLLRSGCFPLPVFFPALAPSRSAWSGGGVEAPQEADVFSPPTHM